MNTVWAMLFLTKSTAKTLQRIHIQRLGAGTLLGGRGLPKDLTSMTVAGGRVVSRPMNGAIEGMLAVLEDPRAEQADAAVAGLVDRYYREGPDVLRPYKPRFRKMLTDRDPGVRRVAAWALAHTGDMDVVPALIDALNDPDEDVVDSARLGLQILSRKIEGLGPPSPSTPEQRKEAAAAMARVVQRHPAAGPRRRGRRRSRRAGRSVRPAPNLRRRPPARRPPGATRHDRKPTNESRTRASPARPRRTHGAQGAGRVVATTGSRRS